MLIVFAAVAEKTPTDQWLLSLLGIITGVLGLLIMLYRGRHPWDVGVDRYKQEKLTDLNIPIEALSEMSGHLFRRDYYAAHKAMLAHTNWFFTRRSQLPADFANTWLMIRSKINRMVAVEQWVQEWAKKDLEEMRQETLQLVDRATQLFIDEFDLEENEEDFDQSTRVILAPNERILSSMHS